jgi:hypothetical protein
VTDASGPDGRLALPSGIHPVVTCVIGADEWVLLAPQAGAHPGMLRQAALAWLASTLPEPGGTVAFVPVRSIDPVLGLAVLHHHPEGATIYCEEINLGAAAAETLSLSACISTPVLLANASQHGPSPRTKVIAVSHGRWLSPSRDSWLHPSLHPLIAHVALPQATIYACDCQVTPALADVLTALCTEQLRLLHARSTAWPRPIRLATLLANRCPPPAHPVAGRCCPPLRSWRPRGSGDELASTPCAWREGGSVAPPRKWTRQSWIDTATKMVSDGANLGEVKLQQLFDANGAAKNSFYNNFTGGLPELHAEVITWWKAQRVPAILEAALNAVENPLERLRILRSVLAGNAIRDEAMRRWAVTDPAAAQAVTDGDKAIAAHALEALHQLGYQGTEADDWAEVIVTIIQSVRPRAYETLLGKLDTSAAGRRAYAGTVGIAAGTAPDELVIYTIAASLPPAALSQLRARAQEFAASVSAADNRQDADEGTVALWRPLLAT